MRLAQTFGANVRRARQARGLTQEALAVDVGLAVTYVGQIERGLRNPTLDVVERFAEVLKVEPLAELFQNAVHLYARHPLGQIGGGPPFADRTSEFGDLLCLADIAASSIEHFLSRREAAKGAPFDVKPGSELVSQWLAHDGIALRKSTILIKPGKGDEIIGSTLEFQTDFPRDDVQHIGIPVRRAHRGHRPLLDRIETSATGAVMTPEPRMSRAAMREFLI